MHCKATKTNHKIMQKLLILKNEDLFTALVQAQSLLPGVEIEHVNELITDNAAIIIGDISDLQMGASKGSHLIVIVDSENSASDIAGTIITRPYHLKELVDVIQNVVSSIQARQYIIEIAGFKFDPIARSLVKDALEIALTEKEAELIMLLSNADGQMVSREEILREVWQYDASVDTHTVETHIYRIRQKLGKENDFITSSLSGYFISKT